MFARRGQRGEGNAGCLFWGILVVALGFVLWKAVPVKMKNAAMYDHMVQLTKFSASSTAEQLKKSVLGKAKELELPVTSKDVEVEKTRDRVKIRCHYTIELEFPGYTYVWNVDHRVDRAIFYL